jgi:hypothetical protein
VVITKIARYILIIILVFGLLGFSNCVFAADNVLTSSESTLHVNPSSASGNVIAPLLKGGSFRGGGVSNEGIQAFMNQPTDYKIFVILSALAIVIFVIWYSLLGKNMNLMFRIPIIIVLLLLIFVPLYLAGNMLFFITAVIVAMIVLMATWYQEHGSKMSKRRLIGTIMGGIVILALVVGIPVYYYFTAAENIDDITISSTVPGLEIVDYKAYRHTYIGTTVEFGGYVKNNGNSTAEFIEINATGYDANGNIVSNIKTFIDADRLSPGSTSEFGYLSNKFPGSFDDPQGKIVRVKLVIIKPTY